MKRAPGSPHRHQILLGISPLRTGINLTTAQAAQPRSQGFSANSQLQQPQSDSLTISKHLLVLLLLPSFKHFRILSKITQNSKIFTLSSSNTSLMGQQELSRDQRITQREILPVGRLWGTPKPAKDPQRGLQNLSKSPRDGLGGAQRGQADSSCALPWGEDTFPVVLAGRRGNPALLPLPEAVHQLGSGPAHSRGSC